MFRPISNSHESPSYQHVVEEIAEHAIWHKVAHVVGLGSYAAGILGRLLSSQSLGERDIYYIPHPISAPKMAKCVNTRKVVEDCLMLPNGNEVVGQDLIRFYQDLQAAQILTNRPV